MSKVPNKSKYSDSVTYQHIPFYDTNVKPPPTKQKKNFFLSILNGKKASSRN